MKKLWLIAILLLVSACANAPTSEIGIQTVVPAMTQITALPTDTLSPTGTPTVAAISTNTPTTTPTSAPETETTITSPVEASATAMPSPLKHSASKIAFVSKAEGQTDVWWIDSDGTSLERLTNDSWIEWGQAWSPDGNTIAYASRPHWSAVNNDTVWLLDVQSKESRRLVDSNLDGVSAPTWSPDGHTIAYSTWVTDVSHIWLVNIETGDNVEIIQHRASPLWSPRDGELGVVGPPVEIELGLRSPMIFFSIIRTDGEPLDHLDWGWDWIKQLTGMAWSHAGDRLLVTAEAGISLPTVASLEIVEVADKTASIAVNHTMKCNDEDCDFYSPSWFPGDKEILFVAAVPLPLRAPYDTPEPDEPEGRWWLYRATDDLSSIQAVFESDLPISDASLSPDGTQIVFVQGEYSDAELWILDLSTGQAMQLTNNDVDDGDPIWQPKP